MGMLEDLLLGLPSGEDLAGREEEYDKWLRGLWPGIKEQFSAGMSDPYEASAEKAGLASSPPPQGEAVAESVAKREQARTEEAQAPDLAKQKILDLQKETNQRSLDALTAGLDPNRGTLSQQPDSPELQQRLAERDAWAAQQPMRDLEFAMTPDQARRNPEYATRAASSLKGLQEQQAIDRRQGIQELFVQSLAGAGGTIPREQAAQLQALGVNVPHMAIGAGVDEGVAFFDSAIQKAGEFLSNLDQFELAGGHPMIQIQKAGAMRAEYYRGLVESGQMNADDARQRFQRELAEMAIKAGVINTEESASMQQ